MLLGGSAHFSSVSASPVQSCLVGEGLSAGLGVSSSSTSGTEAGRKGFRETGLAGGILAQMQRTCRVGGPLVGEFSGKVLWMDLVARVPQRVLWFCGEGFPRVLVEGHHGTVL